MVSGTLTSSQFPAHYDRLTKRVDRVTLRYDLLIEFSGVTNAISNMHLIESSVSAPTAIPNLDEIAEVMHSVLLYLVEVLTDSCIRAPLFTLVFLLKIAYFYRFEVPQDPIYEYLGLSDAEPTNKNIAAHIWFAEFLGCDIETIWASVTRNKKSRGSSDSLRRLSLAILSVNPRAKYAQRSVNTPRATGNTAYRPDSGSGSIYREREVDSFVLWRTQR